MHAPRAISVGRSFDLGFLDRQIIYALIIDSRAPFSRIAVVVGASEQTVARRYRRLHAAAVVRVVAVPNSQRLGPSPRVFPLPCLAHPPPAPPPPPPPPPPTPLAPPPT